MASTALNSRLNTAKSAKKDEFYTQLTDIEKELKHYKAHFRGKVVYCNCDDPNESNFVKYFKLNFEHLGLKKLIATHFKNADLLTRATPYKLEYLGNGKKGGEPDEKKVKITALKDDGDFRGRECLALLKQADIVVTNPPFSLFREYVSQLVEHQKSFLVLGQQNAITYKGIFTLIRDNKLWLGNNNGGTKWFQVPADYDIKTASRKKVENGVKYFSMGSVFWYTNLDHSKRHEVMTLYKHYSRQEFPTYDNYDAIEVKTVAEIPQDYDGVMGVPITFLDHYNPAQFKLLGCNRDIEQDPQGVFGRGSYLDGKETFKRLFIQRRKQ